MSDPNFVLLYVDDAEASATFYAALIGRQPVELSATFALFVMNSGMKLGLWRRDGVEPAASAPAGGAEIAFPVANAAAVEATHAEWTRRKLVIAQPPTEMVFGTTFVALDPDGHRLRVFAPAAA